MAGKRHDRPPERQPGPRTEPGRPARPAHARWRDGDTGPLDTPESVERFAVAENAAAAELAQVNALRTSCPDGPPPRPPR